MCAYVARKQHCQGAEKELWSAFWSVDVADAASVAATDGGFIDVDIQIRTNVPHIFAGCDIVTNPSCWRTKPCRKHT